MWSIETTLIQVAFCVVNQIANSVWASRRWRTATVPGSGQRIHLMPVGQQRHYALPRVSGHEDAV
jgi:hypothetical protein